MGNFSAANSVYETAATRLWDELQSDLSWTIGMVNARRQKIISFYTAKAKQTDTSTARLVANKNRLA